MANVTWSTSRKALRHLAALPASASNASVSSSRTALLQPLPCTSHHSPSHNLVARRTAPSYSTAVSSSSSSPASSSIAPEANAPATAVPPIARSSPEIYAALLPHNRTTLTSLLARLNLSPTASEDEDLMVAKLSSALTHPSWISLRDSYISHVYKRESLGRSLAKHLDATLTSTSVPQQNAALAVLGNSLLGMIITERLHLAYPNLPNRVLKAALSAYAGPQTTADVAVELGLGAKGINKWDVSETSKGNINTKRLLNTKEILSQAMRALVGLMFQTRGFAQTRSFVLSHFLSRLPLPPPISSGPVSSSTISESHPLAPMLNFSEPKRALSLLMDRYDLERPQSRLIAETGRLSCNAVFGVGVFSGSRKIGEGWGSAIRMAEHRAAEDALRRFYLASSPALAPDEVPSSTLDSVFPGSSSPSTSAERIPSTSQGKDIWSVGEEEGEEGVHSSKEGPKYRPREFGESEVVFAIRG